MPLKTGFSKQVSFKASQFSTSSPLVKTGINVLCRKECTLVGKLAVCHRATSQSRAWWGSGQRGRGSPFRWGAVSFCVNTAAKLLASVFLCVISVLLFSLAAPKLQPHHLPEWLLFYFFYFQLYNKRIKYLKLLAYYFIKCFCRRMGVVTVWLSCSIESSNCLVLNSLYLKYAAYFFFIILCEYGVH